MLTELLGDVAPAAIASEDTVLETGGTVVPLHSKGKATGPGAGSETNARKDTLGVVFCPNHCGEATDPFYSSGKRAGQWKKKRGVTDEVYDAWYTEQINAIATAGAASLGATGKDDPINTGEAFGGGTDQTGHGEPAGDPAPEDCGAFMGWVSAKQAAELLTQEDIGNAYAQAGVQVTDLFPPNDEATVKQNVTNLYQILVVKAGA